MICLCLLLWFSAKFLQIAKEADNNGQAAAEDGLMEFSLLPSANATSSSSMHDMINKGAHNLKLSLSKRGLDVLSVY